MLLAKSVIVLWSSERVSRAHVCADLEASRFKDTRGWIQGKLAPFGELELGMKDILAHGVRDSD
jgi:hypothetical protein